MRTLFLSPRQSWPTVSGAKLRDFHFAKALGTRDELTYAYFSAPGGEAPTLAQLPFCKQLIGVPAPDMYTLRKILRGIFGPWPLPVVNYLSPAMQEAVRRTMENNSFDIVHLDSMHMAAYAPLLGGARVVYNWHNIESELMSRYAESAPSIARRIYGSLTARRLASLEKDILGNAFGHVVCSQREKDQLLHLVPGARIAVIENGVDAGAFSRAAGSRAGRQRLVFVGSMNYHANIDAAVWFTHTIWPSIHRRFPDWKLALVGSNPAPAVMALQSGAVEVTGTVPSVAPYYEDALAAIVPLRTGGGTRLKILEAMAAGVPVVSTALGAEGLAVTPDRDILIAGSEQGWLNALASLAEEESRWHAIAAAGRSLVESRYDWEILGKALYETYTDWLKPA